MTSHDLILSVPDLRDATFGIEQALFCFAAGQDLDEPDTLAKAFTAGASLDFRHPAATLAVELDIMHGGPEIVSTIVAATKHLITSHTISNVRVRELSAGRALAHALIEAMHVERETPGRRLLLLNSLDIEAVQLEGAWKIAALRFTNLWRIGEPVVLFPQAEPAARAMER